MAGKQRSFPKRFLYFSGRSCWPPDTGAKLRNWHMPRSVARHAKVTFLSFEDDLVDYRSAEARRAKAEFAEPLERVITLERGKPFSVGKIVKSVVGRLPISVLNYTTEAMKRALARLLDEVDFDAVQLEGIYLWDYLPILRKARSKPLVVSDWHNIESEVQRRFAENTPRLHHALAARYFAYRLRKYEETVSNAIDAHVTVSERDRIELLKLNPSVRAFAVENGVDLRAFDGVGARSAHKDRLLFVGSLDYHANADAAREFAHKAWPAIRKARPDWRFSIVGRNPNDEVKALARLPGVDVAGSVEDVRPYYEGAVAAVVPLRIGGGSRLKILEAMAAGVPVVSTVLGAEGLPTKHDEHLLLTDSVEAMAAPILSLAENPEQTARLIAAGRALVESRYDWSAVGESLMDVYERLRDVPRKP